MTNTVDTLNGLFKEVYAEKIEDLRPDGVMFYKDATFVSRKQQNGNKYHQPVALTHEHGFTYAAAGAGAFDVNAAVAAVHKDAEVTGSQLLLETRLDYESAARATGSPKSFRAATAHIIENMTKSAFKRLEIMSIYGGKTPRWGGICRIGSQVTDSGTTQVYNIVTETWAPGVMAGLENCLVDAYDDDGTNEAPSTKLNATADITITKVDFKNKRVTLTGVEAELDALAAPSTTAAYLYFKGAFDKEPQGAVSIFSNEGSIFGIDAADYSLWAGNTYSAGSAAMTWGKGIEAFDGPVGRGLDELAVFMCNPKTWTNMMTDLAALRHFDGSYSKSKMSNGAMMLEFGAQFGTLQVKPSIFIKEGMALGYAPKKLRRLGATDLTFKTPGMEEEKFLFQLPSNAGYAVRCYANQAPFHPCPAYNVLVEDIVNS